MRLRHTASDPLHLFESKPCHRQFPNSWMPRSHPEPERAELAELIAASLTSAPSSLHPSWSAEVRRRNELRERIVYPAGYQAVICGAAAPNPKDVDFKEANAERLRTLEDVTSACRRYKINIIGFLPTSGFALDDANSVWWTSDPPMNEIDQYAK